MGAKPLWALYIKSSQSSFEDLRPPSLKIRMPEAESNDSKVMSVLYLLGGIMTCYDGFPIRNYI